MGIRGISLDSQGFFSVCGGINLNVSQKTTAGITRKQALTIGENPSRFAAPRDPAQRNKRKIRGMVLREKRRSHTQAAAKERRERPAPALRVKKSPP